MVCITREHGCMNNCSLCNINIFRPHFCCLHVFFHLYEVQKSKWLSDGEYSAGSNKKESWKENSNHFQAGKLLFVLVKNEIKQPKKAYWKKKKTCSKRMRFLLRTKHFFNLFFYYYYLEFSILCINTYQCSYMKKNGSLFMCILFRGWMREILGFGLKFYTQGICCHFILFYLPKKGLITEK